MSCETGHQGHIEDAHDVTLFILDSNRSDAPHAPWFKQFLKKEHGSLQKIDQQPHPRPATSRVRPCLVARNELGGGGESVVDTRVSKVVSKVLHRSLSSDDGLDEESKHGEHGKTSVLDLLDLKLGEGIRIVGKAQRVERTSRVEAVESLSPVESSGRVVPEGLSLSHQDNLDGNSGHDAAFVVQIMAVRVHE